jgi:hypothetical protein
VNLEEEVLREHSKRQALRIAGWINKDKRRLKKLIELFLNGKYRVTQRLAWVVSICAENHPELIGPHLKEMVKKMQQPGVHDAVRRNVVRILQDIDIPNDLLGTVATVCLEYLSSADAPIAVKVFSMSVLANIAQKEPDLRMELRLIIERQLPYAGAGFRSRARNVLKIISAEHTMS